MRRVRLAAAVLAVVGPALLTAPAGAHEEGGVMLTAVIESVTPAREGLSVQVLRSIAPLVELRNATDQPLVVLGEDGEPFLRVGDGVIEGNDRSPTFHSSLDPTDRRPLPAGADAAAAPRWRRLGTGDTWHWFDPRTRRRPASPERALDFELPLRLGTERVVARGSVHLGEVGHLRTVLDDQPGITGLDVRLLEGQVPALFVRNDTGLLLEVPGPDGEPFLRIGPAGVEANTRSPAYYLAAGQTVRAVPSAADPAAEPAWSLLSEQPAWAWLEYRARVPGRPSAPLALGSKPAMVLRWTTPLRLGGRDLDLQGHVDWVPLHAASSTVSMRVVIAALLAVLLLAIWARRRASGSSRSDVHPSRPRSGPPIPAVDQRPVH